SGAIRTEITSSRVGEVAYIPEPVMITYQEPRKRVLFSEARDANPFFHLYESLWMLAGRDDVAPLAYYSSKIAEIASDNGQTFNGAYGRRWRRMLSDSNGDEVDQLKILIEHLRQLPNSRRAVLQMWTVGDDLLNIGTPVDYSKDVCCNTCVYFS